MEIMEEMHESAARLFEAIDRLRPGEAITSRVARLLNVGDNLVTNWKKRGVSEGGAILAESILGIPAAWILSGMHPPLTNSWPFAEWISHDRIRALPREDLIFLAGKLDAALDELERKK